MPRVDKHLDQLGWACGPWQYWTLLFSLHGAHTTFMMDIVLWPHQAYAAAYLDDMVVHSETWEDHLECLQRVLSELRRAGLTANPANAILRFRKRSTWITRLVKKNVEAVQKAQRPLFKTQVRAFLGLAGYYRYYFFSLAASLTDLTRKGQPKKGELDASSGESLLKGEIGYKSVASYNHLLHLSPGILDHFSFTNCSRSLILKGHLFPTAILRFLHRCSMGFRSGLIASHFRTLQRFVAIHFWVLFEVCLGSLSCWKNQDLGCKNLSDTGPYITIQNPLVILRYHDALHTVKTPSARGSQTTPKHL
ncbi:uncharacterized protein LOC122329689 [Puntigrus tetrazona]|uniref:uncharacterized protein LOC122329689 n=1 Tax=Puntigrus tetrazona TaxID=1606681 RepID=UPI001C8A426F|nr:uncharacterized protein LOC122329689 [Puntigrus tetrazona]